MSPAPTIICPCCGEAFDPVSAARGEALGELMAILAGFGGERSLVLDYIQLFRTGKSMQVGTKLRLAGEIRKLLATGRFEFEGRTWRLPRADILECMLQVVRAKGGKGTPPGFANHNYLKQVLKEKARAVEAREEAALEERRRAGARTPEPAPGPLGGNPGPAAGREEERAVWEQPPEAIIEMLATSYRNPGLLGGFDWIKKIETRLRDMGVDLARLKSLVLATPAEQPFLGRGRELLDRCGADHGPEAVAACLPIPPRPALTPARAVELAARARRFCEITRAVKADPRAGARYPDMPEVEKALREAGMDLPTLTGLAWRGVDPGLTDGELLARCGPEVEGNDARH